MIQPHLLLSLAQQNSHGYELTEILGQEGTAPDPGSLYRTLRSPEMEVLHTWVVDIRKTRQGLDDFLAEYEDNISMERKNEDE